MINRFPFFRLSGIALGSAPLAVYGVWNPNWDDRDETVTPKSRHHLFLVRHGQYKTLPSADKRDLEGEEDYLANDKYRPLTPKGIKQAESTGHRLAQVLSNEGLLSENACGVRIYSSDMTRAMQTADIIKTIVENEAKKVNKNDTTINICRDSILREGAPVVPEGYSGPWKPPSWAFAEEGRRIESAFRKFFHRPDVDENNQLVRKGPVKNNATHTVDIVVCHGNVIRYSLMRGLQAPENGWLHFGLYNGSVTRMFIMQDGWIGVTAVGEKGHMPLNIESSS